MSLLRLCSVGSLQERQRCPSMFASRYALWCSWDRPLRWGSFATPLCEGEGVVLGKSLGRLLLELTIVKPLDATVFLGSVVVCTTLLTLWVHLEETILGYPESATTTSMLGGVTLEFSLRPSGGWFTWASQVSCSLGYFGQAGRVSSICHCCFAVP